MIRRLAAVLLLTACSGHSAALHGSVLDPPPPAANFTLTDQNGKAFSLSDARGSAVALYFGFTHCMDVCPQTLQLLSRARLRAQLSPHQLRIVMVTVDPKSDSPAAFRAFFRRLGVQAVGLTGTQAELQRVYRAYGVAVQPAKHDVGHTDSIFLIDPGGRLRELLDPADGVKAVAKDLDAVVG